MKIFSWVHRRFHHKSVANCEDAKKADNDKVTLLQNEAFAGAGAGDGWKEGILSIGTMGIDLIQDFKTKDMKNQMLFFGDDGDDDVENADHEKEMECPLVLKASKHGFNHVEKQHHILCDEVAKPNDIHQQEDVGVKESTNIKKSGERITLADLLWADSEKNLLKNKLFDDHKLKLPYHDNNVDTESINNFLTSKKKIDKDRSVQPIKKTKQLLRKMLKKKIHPDIEIHKQETASILIQERDVHAT